MIQHSGQKIGILESWSRDGGSKLEWVIVLCSWVRLIIRGIARNFQREGSHQFSPPEYCRLFALERLMKEGYGHPWTLPSLVTPLFTNSHSASLHPEILMCTSELSGKPDKMVGVGGGGELARDCKEKLLITSCYKNLAKSKLDGPLGTHACRLSLQFYTCSNISNWMVQYVILEHRS